MTRIQTLQTLLEREEGLRDEALSALRAAQSQLAAATAQSEALAVYRREYHERWSAQFAQGGAIEIVRCYHAFVGRLEQAIGQQNNAVRGAELGVARTRERLKVLEIRVATVQRLMERHARAIAQAQDRREQKNLDELSQRRRPNAAMLGFA